MVDKKNEQTGSRQSQKQKLEEKRKEQRKSALSGVGPIGLIMVKLIDLILDTVVWLAKWLWYDLSIPTFNAVWDLVFSEFHGVFGGKEKDGECFGSGYMRYLMNIIIPPFGVFMAKGLNGWPSIFIATILTLFHIFPGIIYAFVVTHHSRYADRYEQRQLDEIQKRKDLRNSDGDAGDANKYGIVAVGVSMGIIILLVFLFIKLGNIMVTFAQKN